MLRVLNKLILFHVHAPVVAEQNPGLTQPVDVSLIVEVIQDRRC